MRQRAAQRLNPRQAGADPSDMGTYPSRRKQEPEPGYAPKGVKVWEIWHEPDITIFWKPKPDVAAYTTLLKATATAVRAAHSSAADSGGSMKYTLAAVTAFVVSAP